MEFMDMVMGRYATKKFDGKKIPAEQFEKLQEFIRYAPSSYNLQTWKIKVVEDMGVRKKLKEASWGQEQITTCSHLLVFCANTDVEGNLKLLLARMKEEGAAQESLDSFEKMVGGFAKNKQGADGLNWAQKQVYLAVENALLGARALGFDSCPMEGFDAAKYSQILGLPENLVPTCVVPVGYAADTARKKIRLGKKDVFF
ncbi:MAG: NAD(P)H-dependent oxidoreductase [Candidatus Micrarchaeota archaeon]